jgi:hypothetical protein
MEPESSLLCSQGPSTGPYPDPDQSNPYRENEYKVLAGKPEGRKIYGRHSHNLKDHIKMRLQDIVWEGVATLTL